MCNPTRISEEFTEKDEEENAFHGSHQSMGEDVEKYFRKKKRKKFLSVFD